MRRKINQISNGVNPKIFKAYDIRGIYPEEINEEIAYLIGGAFVKFLEKSCTGKTGKLNIVAGRDNRLSGPALHKNLVKGIIDAGANVIDIGLSTTPMFYFAVAHYGYDGGINTTASHNPKNYNGFKIVREGAVPISEATGLKEIQNLTRFHLVRSRPRGGAVRKNILKDYLRFNTKNFNFREFKSLKIVADTANAVPGILMPGLSKKIKGRFFPLFWKLDGNFPNHSPDPLVKENLRYLRVKVKQEKADLGVAFDGDGDRIIFVDERGEIILADLITALVVPPILKSNPGEKILYDVRSSNIVKETIEAHSGVPTIYRVGHSFIKEKMRKENIVFAGEFSGHYYHQKHYFCEAPLFVLFTILKEISQSQKSLSKLIKPLKIYFHSGEINFKVKGKEKILAKLEKRYKKGRISYIDGLRIDFKDWWFNVRPSHTEPVLRLVLEAKTKKLMEEKKKELIKIMGS